MTTTTATQTETKEYTIYYPVTIYHQVTVERPTTITEAELLESISKEDLLNGTEDNDCGWDSLKTEWRGATPGDLVIQDEDCNDLFQD